MDRLCKCMQQYRSALECQCLNEQAVDAGRIQTLLCRLIQVNSQLYAVCLPRADGAIVVCWQPLVRGICCLMVSQPGQQCMQPSKPACQAPSNVFRKPEYSWRKSFVRYGDKPPTASLALLHVTTHRLLPHSR